MSSTHLKLVPEAVYDEGRGCLRIVASVEEPDRDNEVVVPRTIRLGKYKANPVVLWAHGQQTHPIARCEDDDGRFTCEVNPAGQLVQEWYFAKTEDGRKAAELYRDRVLRGASIGFISDGTRDIGPDEAYARFGVRKKLKEHIGGELVETSAVPVPACPGALALGWLDQSAARALISRGGAGALVTKSLTAFLTRATPSPTVSPSPQGTTVSQTATADATVPVTTVKAMETTSDTGGGSTVGDKPAGEDGQEEIKTAFRNAFHKSADELFDAGHEDTDAHKKCFKTMKMCHKSYVRHMKGVEGEEEAEGEEEGGKEGSGMSEDDQKAFLDVVRKAAEEVVDAKLSPLAAEFDEFRTKTAADIGLIVENQSLLVTA